MTPKQLLALTTKWQARLEMRHWEIDLKIARYWQMHQGALGMCSPVPESCKATITMLDPRDIPEDGHNEDFDIEVTLVHELLHCIFATFENEELTHERAQHAVIHGLARSLVRVAREGKK